MPPRSLVGCRHMPNAIQVFYPLSRRARHHCDRSPMFVGEVAQPVRPGSLIRSSVAVWLTLPARSTERRTKMKSKDSCLSLATSPQAKKMLSWMIRTSWSYKLADLPGFSRVAPGSQPAAGVAPCRCDAPVGSPDNGSPRSRSEISASRTSTSARPLRRESPGCTARSAAPGPRKSSAVHGTSGKNPACGRLLGPHRVAWVD
jgi:hypothetical protein